MNKKLVILIVTLVVVLSVAFVAVFGSEAFGNYTKIKVESIFFLKEDNTPHENDKVIEKAKDKDEVRIKWGISPQNANDKRVSVRSNKNEVKVKIEGEYVVITFLADVDVEITIRAIEVGREATIKFVIYDGHDEL